MRILVIAALIPILYGSQDSWGMAEARLEMEVESVANESVLLRLEKKESPTDAWDERYAFRARSLRFWAVLENHGEAISNVVRVKVSAPGMSFGAGDAPAGWIDEGPCVVGDRATRCFSANQVPADEIVRFVFYVRVPGDYSEARARVTASVDIAGVAPSEIDLPVFPMGTLTRRGSFDIVFRNNLKGVPLYMAGSYLDYPNNPVVEAWSAPAAALDEWRIGALVDGTSVTIPQASFNMPGFVYGRKTDPRLKLNEGSVLSMIALTDLTGTVHAFLPLGPRGYSGSIDFTGGKLEILGQQGETEVTVFRQEKYSFGFFMEAECPADPQADPYVPVSASASQTGIHLEGGYEKVSEEKVAFTNSNWVNQIELEVGLHEPLYFACPTRPAMMR